MGSLEELHRATFAGTLVIAWAQRVPTGQLLAVGNCAMLSPTSARRATRSTPGIVSQRHRLRQLRLLSADVLQAFFEQSNFVFHKLYLIQ
jgi:hypothetical protein